MRLHIKTGRFRLHLVLPTCLILNRLALTIALRAARPYVSLSPEGRGELLRLMRFCRQQYRGLCLVDIRTSQGEQIFLRL